MEGLLRTEYACVMCDITMRKAEVEAHKIDTGHHITKKIIYPKAELARDFKIVIETTQTIKPLAKTDSYCLTCSKVTFAPALHRGQGHEVHTKQ